MGQPVCPRVSHSATLSMLQKMASNASSLHLAAPRLSCRIRKFEPSQITAQIAVWTIGPSWRNKKAALPEGKSGFD